MTAPEFADQHGDPTRWTPVEVEIYEHLAEADQAPGTDTTAHPTAA